MTDMKKVLAGLKCCASHECYAAGCPYYDNDVGIEDCTGMLAADALSLLKAQESVKPDVDVDTWICGKCGHNLEHQEMVGSNILFHEQYSYCPNCGRAVKWDG